MKRRGSIEKPKGFWGAEILLTQLKMQARMFLDAAIVVLVVWIILLLAYLHFQYGLGVIFHNFIVYMKAEWDVLFHVNRLFPLCRGDNCSSIGYYPPDVTAHVYTRWFNGVLASVLGFASLLLLIYPVGVFVILRVFKGKAKEVANAEHLRGRRILTEKELAEELPKPGRLPLLKRVKLPVEYETQHLLVIGKTGMGKTTLISQQLQTVRDEKLKTIIYDYKGDYIRRFFDPEKDKLLNPLDKRSAPWNIFNDIETELDAVTFATSLIPPSNITSSERYWLDGARTVFLAILRSCIKDKETTNAAIWKRLSMPVSELHSYLLAHNENAACTFIDPEAKSQAAGIVSTLMDFTQIFEKMQHINGNFSLKKWLLNEDETGCLFVVGHEQVKDLLRPILSLSVDFLTRSVLSLSDDLNRRVFFFVDELGTLQYLPSLIDFLTEARSKGGCLIAGTQDLGRLRKIYGKDILDTLLVNFTNLLSFGVEGESAEIVSRLFGEEETTETNVHYNFGPMDVRDGMNLRKDRRIKRIVLASELASLRKFEAFVKLTEGQLAKGEIKKKFVSARDDIKEFEPIEVLKIEHIVEQNKGEIDESSCKRNESMEKEEKLKDY